MTFIIEYCKKNLVLILILLGLLIRIGISPLDSSGDIHNHDAWGKELIKNGPQHFYDTNFRKIYNANDANYPPVGSMLFAASFLLYFFLKAIIWDINIAIPFFPSTLVTLFQNPILLSVFLKLPAIISDIGIAILIYMFLKRTHFSYAKRILGISLILFNPAFFYNSASWGQIDSIPLFFLLLSIYCIYFKREYIFGGVTLAISLLTKQTVVIFLPFILILLLKTTKLKNVGTYIISSILSFILLFLPFFNGKEFILIFPFKLYWQKIVNGSISNYTTDHAFNIWYLFHGSTKTPDSTSILAMSFYSISILLVSISLVIIILPLLKRKLELNAFFLANALCALTTFILLTRMHERHLLQVLPFLIIPALTDNVLLVIFLYISLFNTLNLYHNWWSPSLPFLHYVMSLSSTIHFLIILLILLSLVGFIKYYSGLANINFLIKYYNAKKKKLE